MKTKKILFGFAIIFVLVLSFVSGDSLKETSEKSSSISNTDIALRAIVDAYASETDLLFSRLKMFGSNSASFMLKELKKRDSVDISEFDKRYGFIDGAYRTNLSYYIEFSESEDITGAFVSSNTPLTDDIKKIFLSSEPQFKSYALAAQENFFNTYLITKDNFIRIYEKDWALEIEPDHDFSKDIFYYISTPENNHEQIPKWTPVYYDSIWNYWMTSLITPIYDGDEFLGIAGHDLILNDLYEGIKSKKYGGQGYSFIFDADKNIVVHPHYLDKLEEKATMNSNLNFKDLDEVGLSDAISKLSSTDTEGMLTFTDNFKDYYFVYKKLTAINWYYGFVIDASLIEKKTEIDKHEDKDISTFFIVAILLAVMFVSVLLAIKFNLINIERNTIMMLMGVTVIIISIILVYNMFSITEQMKSNSEKQFQDQKLLLAREAARDIEIYLQMINNDMTVTSMYLSSITSSPKTQEIYSTTERMHMRLGSYVDNIQLMDTTGNIEASFSSSEEKLSPAFDKIISAQNVMNPRGTIQETFIDDSDDLLLSIATPITTNYSLTGIALANIHLSTLLKKHITPIALEKKVHAHLLIGDLIYQADGLSTTAIDSIKDEIQAGQSGSMNSVYFPHIIDDKTHLMLSNLVYYPVKVGDRYWGLIIMTPTSDVHESISKDITRIWWFVLSIILILVIAGIVFAQLLTKTLSREIIKKTDELSMLNKELDEKVFTRTKELQDVSHNLENNVQERTKELNEKVRELEETKAATLNMMEDLTEAMKKQKQLEKVKTEFLSVTSHELRTPITPMRAQVQMMLEEYFGKVSDDQKKSLGMILRNLTRLDHLIGDILDISKLESGNMKFIMAEADMKEVVNNATETMKFKADEKNIRMEWEVDNIPKITADKDRITQVIVNLINNAVKFTDTNGKIKVLLKNEQTQCRVEVHDSGIGISKQDQKRIFSPFVQADQSDTRKYEGSGLGLAICRGIILQHHGEIGVESVSGKGSTFWFTLPYAYSDKQEKVEVELFHFDRDQSLKKFRQKLKKEGYVPVEEHFDELLKKGIISDSGELKYDITYKELVEKEYIEKEGEKKND